MQRFLFRRIRVNLIGEKAILLQIGSRNEHVFLLDYLAKTFAKVHRKTETKCLLGILFIKTSEKANFYGDVINARQGQKRI